MDATDRPRTDAASGNGQPAPTSSGLSVLLVDDNPAVARAVEIAFRMAGHRLAVVTGPEEAYSRLAAERFDAVLLDMNFTAGRSGGEEGLACLARMIADDPAACIVVITAHSGIRIAVAAMQAGARDFAMKPWRNAELIAKVEAAVARGVAPAAAPARPAAEPAHLLGESAAIGRLRALIRRVAPTSAGVAVTGPAGSGRTLTAMAIHAASGDPAPPTRIDLRGDDAWARLPDLSGTAILRHVDALDPVAQDRLVDLLPAAVRPIAILGDAAPLVPTARRRLATVEVAVPPLHGREDDAVLLARHFARVAGVRFGRGEMRLTPAAEAAVRAGRWADEVRGLALAVERAALLADGDAIDAAALAPPPPPAPPAPAPADAGAAASPLSDAERAIIVAALAEHRHNVTHAASALGLSRGALYRRMARYGL